MTATAAPRLADLFASRERRRAVLDYWRAMGPADWRDLVVIAVLRRLPIDLASGFGAISGGVRGPNAHPEQDIRARINLARLRPGLPEAERETMLAARWRCIGRTFAEFAVLDRMIARGRVEVEGVEHLAAAKAEGRGYIVLGLHLGNWEALAIAGRLGFPVASFYQPRDARAREHISQASRRRLGVMLLAPGPSGVRPALRILKDGGMVMIFADELTGGVVRAPLFGRAPDPHHNLAYAARLARRAGAPVIPAYGLRSEGARLKAVFAPPIRLAEAAEGDSTLPDIERLNAAIEPIVLAHLDQWYFLDDPLEEAPP